MHVHGTGRLLGEPVEDNSLFVDLDVLATDEAEPAKADVA
jgi:hypothetical protein